MEEKELEIRVTFEELLDGFREFMKNKITDVDVKDFNKRMDDFAREYSARAYEEITPGFLEYLREKEGHLTHRTYLREMAAYLPYHIKTKEKERKKEKEREKGKKK